MQSYFEVITPASSEPVTATDAKTFMRIDTDAEDALIDSIISGAREAAEKLMNRVFSPQVLRVSFPFSEESSFNEILRSPVNAIDSVEIWNGSAFEAFTDYFLQPTNGFPKICYTSVPPNFTDVPFNIRIQFQAGYTTIPNDLVLALKQHVAFLYENRGDTPSIGKLSIPKEAEFVYRKYRVVAIYA